MCRSSFTSIKLYCIRYIVKYVYQVVLKSSFSVKFSSVNGQVFGYNLWYASRMQTQSPKHWIGTLTRPESSFHAITPAPIAWLVARSAATTLSFGGALSWIKIRSRVRIRRTKFMKGGTLFRAPRQQFTIIATPYALGAS